MSLFRDGIVEAVQPAMLGLLGDNVTYIDPRGVRVSLVAILEETAGDVQKDQGGVRRERRGWLKCPLSPVIAVGANQGSFEVNGETWHAVGRHLDSGWQVIAVLCVSMQSLRQGRPGQVQGS